MKNIIKMASLSLCAVFTLCSCANGEGESDKISSQSSLSQVENSSEISSSDSESSEANSKPLSEIFSGKWVNFDNNIVWEFDGKDKVLVNDVSHNYEVSRGLSNDLILKIDSQKFIIMEFKPKNEIYYRMGKEYGSFHHVESEFYLEKKRVQKALNSSTQLRKKYPDNSGWIDENCGDIPALADSNFIDESLKKGYFEVGTPVELASFTYYVNTAVLDEDEMLDLIIKNDIDLKGYEWAPIGWHSNYMQALIQGNNFTISNLTINSTSNDAGFIGCEHLSGVYNLNIKNAKINGKSNTGIMAGTSIVGYFVNCSVQGEVNGSKAGAFHGHSTSTFEGCSADVIVNGEKSDFMTYNEKKVSEIKIENPVTITIDEDFVIFRPSVDGYQNLGWLVKCDGATVVDANAENQLNYSPFEPHYGQYDVCLTAYVSGEYVPISNTISYNFSEISGKTLIEE